MKKTILTFSALLIATMYLNGQSCLPEGIIFTTQSQIDSFQINYPGCTEIEGVVTITGMNIDNLNGLNALNSINGSLYIDGTSLSTLEGIDNIISVRGGMEIFWNPNLESLSGMEAIDTIPSLFIWMNESLVDLKGLDSLQYIEDWFAVEMNLNLTCLDGLNKLKGIGGDAYIGCIAGTGVGHTNPSLKTLSGLNFLQFVGGNLWICLNDSLENLSGLENLDSIGGDLSIFANPHLVSLSGLENLTYVGNGLNIFKNPVLDDLNGLEGLDPMSIQALSIYENSSLTSCNAQPICDYLQMPNGEVNIFLNASGCNNPPEVAANCGITLPCLPFGNYYFYSQNDIDNFQSDYPGCSLLEGDVYIGKHWDTTNIINLAGLLTIQSISGSLNINANKDLNDLEGLNNLDSTGKLRIAYNDMLSSLAGLEGLSSSGSLRINDNEILQNLNGLGGLTTVDGYISICNNNSLSSLQGLEGITSINGWISIRDNNGLVNLDGLENIDSQSIEDLSISSNSQLSKCDVESVCAYLMNPNGEVSIWENAPGCNSIEEVEEACEFVTVEEYTYSDEQLLYPNPSDGVVNIKYSLIEDSRVAIDIFNLSGLKVLHVLDNEEKKGEHQRLVDLGNLPPGMYLCVMQTGNGKVVEKIVKH